MPASPVMVYIQILINGVLLGGLYACMAIGFSVIWGVMNIINLAHGSMIIMGAYITYWIWSRFGLDPFATIPVSAAALFGFGFFLQKYLLNRLVVTSVFLSLIFTFGLDMVLTNVHLKLFQADLRAVHTEYATSSFVVESVRIPYARLAVFATAIALTLLLMSLMNRTRTGNAIKATSFDAQAAELVGINTRLIYSITFAVGAMMAGIAGSLDRHGVAVLAVRICGLYDEVVRGRHPRWAWQHPGRYRGRPRAGCGRVLHRVLAAGVRRPRQLWPAPGGPAHEAPRALRQEVLCRRLATIRLSSADVCCRRAGS